MRVFIIASLLFAASMAQTDDIPECASNNLSKECQTAVLNACPYLYIQGLNSEDLNGFYQANPDHEWNGYYAAKKELPDREATIYYFPNYNWMFRATDPMVLAVPQGTQSATTWQYYPPNNDNWAGYDSNAGAQVIINDVWMSCSTVDRVTTVPPSIAPSYTQPTKHPSPVDPTANPTSVSPSASPSPNDPTVSPSTSGPTNIPSRSPTTDEPTSSPSSSEPTGIPSNPPSVQPSGRPSAQPTSAKPTFNPSQSPSYSPSTSPSGSPTKSPVFSVPTLSPSTSSPSNIPSPMPTSDCSTIELYQGVCNTQQGANWIFAIDSSSNIADEAFDQMQAWIVSIQQDIIPPDDESTFGVIQFADTATTVLESGRSDSRVTWQLRTLLMNQLSSSETSVQGAIEEASNMFSTVRNVNKDEVFILILANQPTESNCRELTNLQDNGVFVVVVAIGGFNTNSVSCLTPTSHQLVKLGSASELIDLDTYGVFCQETFFSGGFNRLEESEMAEGKYVFENAYGSRLQYTPDELWAVFDVTYTNALLSVGFGGFPLAQGDKYPMDKQCWDQIVADPNAFTYMCHIRIVCSSTMTPSLSPSNSDEPSKFPSWNPSIPPTIMPTPTAPSANPSNDPSRFPTDTPTLEPTCEPTDMPTLEPTDEPTPFPSGSPTSSFPTRTPTYMPSDVPTTTPSKAPTYPATRPPSSPNQPCHYLRVEDHEHQSVKPYVGFWTTQPDLKNGYPWFKFMTWDGEEKGELFAQEGRWFFQVATIPDAFFSAHVSDDTDYPPDDAAWDSFDGRQFHTVYNVGIYCTLEHPDWTELPTEAPSTDQPTKMPTNVPTVSYPTHVPSVKPSDVPSRMPTVQPSERPSLDPTPTPIVYFWLNFTQVLSCSQTLIQVSEVKFNDGSIRMETVEAVNESGSPNGEGVDMLNDGLTSSKWLDGGFVCESNGGEGKRIKGTLSAIPTEYEIFTANDNPRRDPIEWDIHICSGETCWCDHNRQVDSNFRRFTGLGKFGFQECLVFTKNPSNSPSLQPSYADSMPPTISPSDAPVGTPSATPSYTPSTIPSDLPSVTPSCEPSGAPTGSPTPSPTDFPSQTPSKIPSDAPSMAPTTMPTHKPSTTPVTSAPSITPSIKPTTTHTKCPTTARPTETPTITPSDQPSEPPSVQPSNAPSPSPTDVPTPTDPSASPSMPPTPTPTGSPTEIPSLNPSYFPSTTPVTSTPTTTPSDNPVADPTPSPTFRPSDLPTASTAQPSARPTEDNFFSSGEDIYVFMTVGECMDVNRMRFDQFIGSTTRESCAELCSKYSDCVGISTGTIWPLCQLGFMDGQLPDETPSGFGVGNTGSGSTKEVGSFSDINTFSLECFRRMKPPTPRPTTSPTSPPSQPPTLAPSNSSPSMSPSTDTPTIAPSFTTVAPTATPSLTPSISEPSRSPTAQTRRPTTVDEIPIHTANDDFQLAFPGICKDMNGDDLDGIIIRNVGNKQACADYCAGFHACLGFTWFEANTMCSLMFQDETYPKEYLLFNWDLSDTGDGDTCVIGDFEQTTNAEFFECYRRLRDPICTTQIAVSTVTPTEEFKSISPSMSPSTTTTSTTLKPTSSISDCDDLRGDIDAYVECLKTRITSLENRVDNMETTCRSYCDNIKNEIEFSLLSNTCDQ